MVKWWCFQSPEWTNSFLRCSSRFVNILASVYKCHGNIIPLYLITQFLQLSIPLKQQTSLSDLFLEQRMRCSGGNGTITTGMVVGGELRYLGGEMMKSISLLLEATLSAPKKRSRNSAPKSNSATAGKAIVDLGRDAKDRNKIQKYTFVVETENNTTKVLRDHRAHRKQIIADAAAAKNERFEAGLTDAQKQKKRHPGETQI